MQLDEIMSARVVTVAPRETASAAWTRMRRRHIRHLVVMDDGRLAGVVSERDLGGRAGAAMRRGRTVQSLMTRNVVSAERETTVGEAADVIRERLIGSLPVMDGERLVGIVTATDVFDALGKERVPRMSQAERQLLRAPSSSKKLGGRPVARPRSTARARTSSRRPSNRTKREPLAAELPKATKSTLGRTEAPLVPAHIRVFGVEVDDDTRDYIRGKLGIKFGKFAMSIERISVRMRDVNGPRGGVARRCQIKVVLSGLPSVVAEAQEATLEAAIDEAITVATRGVRRSLQRRRMKPIKRVRSGQPITAPS